LLALLLATTVSIFLATVIRRAIELRREARHFSVDALWDLW
jgi:hypothetical protein